MSIHHFKTVIKPWWTQRNMKICFLVKYIFFYNLSWKRLRFCKKPRNQFELLFLLNKLYWSCGIFFNCSEMGFYSFFTLANELNSMKKGHVSKERMKNWLRLWLRSKSNSAQSNNIFGLCTFCDTLSYQNHNHCLVSLLPHMCKDTFSD